MWKAVAAVLGVALAAVSVTEIRRNARYPRAEGPAAEQPPRTGEEALAAALTALRNDAGSPYRWCDTAEALMDTGREAEAARSIERATALGARIPAIRIRAANVYFRKGDTLRAVRESASVLAMVPDYDAIVFATFDRLAPDVSQVLPELAGDKRSVQAYFEHLVKTRQGDAAARVWQLLSERRFANDELAARYVAFLFDEKRFETAAGTWTAYVGDRRGDYRRGNEVYNGGFEHEFTTAPLDWRAPPEIDGVRLRREEGAAASGKWALRMDFPGDRNMDFRGPLQDAVLEPGSYRFSASLRTDGITTDEGVRLSVMALDDPGRPLVLTEGVRGTQPWTQLSQSFQVAGRTRVVRIQARRQSSLKIESKIAGTAWLDDVAITGARSSARGGL